MRFSSVAILSAAAVLGLGALALPAAGKNPATHEMTIQLPDGGTEIVSYIGNVAPKVSFVPVPVGVDWLEPKTQGFDPSFVALDRIAADMDRQMDAFWRQAQMVANWSAKGDLSQAAIQHLGPGGSANFFVSESFGNNICTRMTEITASPDGGKPKVVSRTSGNCDASPAGPPASSNRLGADRIPVHNAIPATIVNRTAL